MAGQDGCADGWVGLGHIGIGHSVENIPNDNLV